MLSLMVVEYASKVTVSVCICFSIICNVCISKFELLYNYNIGNVEYSYNVLLLLMY